MYWGYKGVVDFQGRHLMREQAMYACNRESGRGFFAGGVLAGESGSHYSRPTSTALRFADGVAPVSPHAQHVDDQNQS
jgi:hypothetical protein